MGRKRPDLAERNRLRKGVKLGPRSEETKAKISSATKGKPRPWVAEHNRKRKGIPHKPHSEETKRKISQALKGVPKTETHKIAMRGVPKTITPAFRKAQSERQRKNNMMWSPGASEKLSEFKTKWWQDLPVDKRKDILKKMSKERKDWWASLTPERFKEEIEKRTPDRPCADLIDASSPDFDINKHFGVDDISEYFHTP